MPPRDLVIGLGANLGDPLAAFRAAVQNIGTWLQVRAVSPVYRTRAVGPEQPDYLNAAVLGATALSPEVVLERLLDHERVAGRVRLERWGPRVLDLDLLWLQGLTVESPGLCVPHPRLEQRAFALVPLLDVAPHARHPSTGRPYRELLPTVADQEIAQQLQYWL
jgi:2-amino-4-hydroxy-6-hydroxymethyldihydropteridine diphosphokinase